MRALRIFARMQGQSEFSRNVIKVIGGTGLAQAITIGISPILSRLYSPDDFGLLYLFSALTAILLVPSTGRYEMAVLIPEREQDAYSLVAGAALLSTSFSLLILVIVWWLNPEISQLLGSPDIGPWLYWLPLAIWLQGLLATLNVWQNRHKRFGRITTNKVVLASSNAGSRTLFGQWQWGTGGLILGTVIAQFTALLHHLWHFWRVDRRQLAMPTRTEIQQQMQRFAHFPRNVVAGGLANVASQQLPAILLNTLFSASMAGLFGFMNRIVRLPVQVVGRSFGEVFKQKAAEEYQQFGHCRAIFFQTLRRLSLLAILPFGILFLIAPDLFAWVFSEEWRIAGEYARIFALPLYLQFIVSPLTSILYLSEQTRWYSAMQFTLLVLVLLAFLLGYTIFADEGALIYLLAAAYGIAYILILIVLLRIVNK